jgi:RNA recognition motif-containing protein
VIVLLIIDHLPHGFSEEEFTELFRPFGKIHSCRIVRDHSGRSLDFGFVELDEEKAARAVEALDAKEVQGHQIRVHSLNDLPASGTA